MRFVFFVIILLLSSCLRVDAAASIWEWLAIDGVIADTGYPWDILDYIFLKYYDDIISPQKIGRRTPCREHNATWDHIHFYILFV